ncbi:MAG TPA: hypothetical protein V6D17_16915 [Candidatus Obscuribacterales bacterium]
MFILTCVWEEHGDLPVWSLYEQVGEDSKMHWSKQFPPSDLQLLYDMVAMTVVVDADSAGKIPDTLKPTADSPPASPQFAQPAPPDYGQAPQGYPGAAYPGYYPPPAPMGYPQAYPPVMPGYPAQPMPGYGMPAVPMDPAAQWAYSAVQQTLPASTPPAPAPPAAPAPPPEPAKTSMTPLMQQSGVFKRIDMSLIAKGKKLDLGTLLLDARLIKQNSLEAALKIQGMVEDGKIDPDIAPLALERFHSEGARIDQYLTGDVLEKMREKSKQAPAPSQETKQPEQAKPAAKGSGKSPEEVQKIRQAFDVLKKAGIIDDKDIETAQGVLRKTGGDIVQILIAANKFDKNTYEAAHIVRPLISSGLMKPEQAIIALNYCCRSRVDFDTALEEMGWQNPRKLRKDLDL